MDLLFYHRSLRRVIVVDLQLGKFKPEYEGQMRLYLNYLDKIRVWHRVLDTQCQNGGGRRQGARRDLRGMSAGWARLDGGAARWADYRYKNVTKK